LVGDAWDLVTGNYWRLVACLIACCVPFAILSYVVNEIADALPSILWIVFQIILLALWFASSAVVASLLSDVYRRLSPSEAAAERPT
jgi:predicted permease